MGADPAEPGPYRGKAAAAGKREGGGGPGEPIRFDLKRRALFRPGPSPYSGDFPILFPRPRGRSFFGPRGRAKGSLPPAQGGGEGAPVPIAQSFPAALAPAERPAGVRKRAGPGEGAAQLPPAAVGCRKMAPAVHVTHPSSLQSRVPVHDSRSAAGKRGGGGSEARGGAARARADNRRVAPTWDQERDREGCGHQDGRWCQLRSTKTHMGRALAGETAWEAAAGKAGGGGAKP